MGDKEQFMGTVPLKITRSVAAPGQKTHKKGGKGVVPKKLTTAVLPARGARRPDDKRPNRPIRKETPPSIIVDIIDGVPTVRASHKPGHVKKPRTAKQIAATAANFKKMMKKASKQAPKR